MRANVWNTFEFELVY